METGTVTGFEVGKNRDGSQNVLKLQVYISDPGDSQTVEYYPLAGDNSVPNKGARVYILDAGESWKIAVASNDMLDFLDTLNAGERYLYSLDDSSVIKAFVKWRDTGVLNVNGYDDLAVRYNQLNTTLQALIDSINAETTKIATAVPVYAGTRADISQDFTSARVDNVTLKGVNE